MGSPDRLASVGIDVGTTTTQIVTSRLWLGSTDPTDAGKLTVIDREITHRGEIHRTPLSDETTIDADGVAAIVDRELAAAGLEPADIDTGAVIVTGETARRANAASIVRELAVDVGDFVVETAGAALEAVLAGRGSGAAARAERNDETVVNVDIGGGTTNVAVFEGDRVRETRCCAIGARLIEFDSPLAVLDSGGVKNSSEPVESPTVTEVSSSLDPLLSDRGLEIEPGDLLGAADCRDLAAAMASVVAALVEGPPYPPVVEGLAIGELPTEPVAFDAVCFSGGVGDLVHAGEADRSRRSESLDDLGEQLAAAIRADDRIAAWPVVAAEETVRATVIGAGVAVTTLSGRTLAIEPDLLPLRNVPVVDVGDVASIDGAELREYLRQAFERGQELYGSDDSDPGGDIAPTAGEDDVVPGVRFAIGLGRVGVLSYGRIESIASAIVEGSEHVDYRGPILVVVEQNCAKALGQTLRRETRSPIVAIDEVAVDDGEYLDVGSPIGDDDTVPIAVKSLVFGAN